nr:hypothetical protein [Tanacetum cinerariifolium]
MMACLERTDGNAEFHQIVDFVTTCPIHYALTQIHATIDGKTVVISESSVKSDRHFNDEDGSRPRFQDTTLRDVDAKTRFKTASKQFHDPPLLEVNTSRSREDSMEHQDDLIDFVPPNPMIHLSEGHTSRSDE